MQEEDNNSLKEKEIREDIKKVSILLKQEILEKEQELKQLQNELLLIENEK
jgi:hypothetical protein